MSDELDELVPRLRALGVAEYVGLVEGRGDIPVTLKLGPLPAPPPVDKPSDPGPPLTPEQRREKAYEDVEKKLWGDG